MARLIKGRSFYKEPWYNSYHSMMDRCYREKAKNYPFYGGRGICVCTEWHNIEEFEKWALQNGFQRGLTLDRIDPNGDYSPSNCRWATKRQRANNRINTTYISYNGETHTISEWAELLGINRSTLKNRYLNGLPLEKVFSKSNLDFWESRRKKK